MIFFHIVPLESFLDRMCIRCMAIPTPHIISIIWHLLPMIVLIDVSLSHPLCLHPPPYSLFAILSVYFRAYAHPLHECSKYRKGVDQIDLYLASGLGTSQDKIPKKTKFETLVDWVLNKNTFFSYYLSPFWQANTIWRHSSHGQRELLHLMFFCCLIQC